MSVRILVALAVLLPACAPRQTRALHKASGSLSRAVAREDAEQVRAHVVPGARAQVDTTAMTRSPEIRRRWAKNLDDPEQVRPEAIVFIGPQQPVRVVWTDQGWRFAEDPTDVYAHKTPHQALRALVRATRAGRWDVSDQPNHRS